MTFYVKDPATDKAVRRLAKLKGKTLTDTIREAVEKEYASSKDTKGVAEKLDELAERFSAFRAAACRPTRRSSTNFLAIIDVC